MRKNLISIMLILFMSLSIYQYAKLVTPYLKTEYTFALELLFMSIQILLQSVLLYFVNKNVLQEYVYAKSIALGIGGALLWIFMGIFYLFPVSARVAVVAFVFTLAVVYAVHQERVYAIKLPYYFCYTWVLYRMFVFALIAGF